MVQSSSFKHFIRDSEVSSIISGQDQVYISHSILGQGESTGSGIECVFTDNGSGVALDQDCKAQTP